MLPVLITNNHILDENDIKPKIKIEIFINDFQYSKVIDLNNSQNTYTIKKPFDVTFIEYEKKDNINSMSYLEIDDILNENAHKNYYQKSIYLIHYSHQVVEFSTGEIKSISEDSCHSIQHYCETEYGSSGSPIINLINYIVIGVHKGSSDKNYNVGTFLKTPIEKFIDEIKKKKDKYIF